VPTTQYLGRKAVCIENTDLRVTVTQEGGHIAEVFSKAAGISPLWVPGWTSGEPSSFGPEQEAIFGTGSDARLLYGIFGHNLCLDLFGGPSDAEAAAGMTAHGEGSLLPYVIEDDGVSMTCRLHMPLAQLEFERTLTLHGPDIAVVETVTNLTAFDRPLAWTQHVALSPPYLDPKTTELRATVDRGMIAESDIGAAAYLQLGGRFAWPHAPLQNGGTHDLQRMKAEAPASNYAALRMISTAKAAGWTVWSPASKLAFSYVWKPSDFPWLGLWEEHCSRPWSPWNNAAITLGLEFGTSPFPESRQRMIERARLFDTPTFRWLPAGETLQVAYWIRTAITDTIPEMVSFPA
jgi:hypothetical protein